MGDLLSSCQYSSNDKAIFFFQSLDLKTNLKGYHCMIASTGQSPNPDPSFKSQIILPSPLFPPLTTFPLPLPRFSVFPTYRVSALLHFLHMVCPFFSSAAVFLFFFPLTLFRSFGSLGPLFFLIRTLWLSLSHFRRPHFRCMRLFL